MRRLGIEMCYPLTVPSHMYTRDYAHTIIHTPVHEKVRLVCTTQHHILAQDTIGPKDGWTVLTLSCKSISALADNNILTTSLCHSEMKPSVMTIHSEEMNT